MNISINWQSGGVVGEQSCTAWLSTLTDGCDIPTAGSANLKHGGTISYQSDAVTASLSITPLVVQREWDMGQVTSIQCADVGGTQYLDQATLQANIADYCAKSAAQPNDIAAAGSYFEQVYNDGTPDRVVLTTNWPNGQREYQVFQDECSYYMSSIK